MKENNNNQNQTINCTVSSCKFNNGQRQQCELENIIVTPVEGCQTKQPDDPVLRRR